MLLYNTFRKNKNNELKGSLIKMSYPKVINWIYKQDKKSKHIEVYYAEDDYPAIRKTIKKNALNSERAFKELKEVGIDLGAIY